MPIAKWKKPILKDHILYYCNYNDSLKTRETEGKKLVFFKSLEEGGEEWTGDFFQLPTIMADAGPYTFVKTHWIYNTKSDVNCGL